MSDIIQEKLIEEQPIPVSLEGTKKIIFQMENCICQIYSKNGERGTGFFCKIPFNNNLLPVLITNNHVLNEKDIENNNIIELSINNDKKEIKIDNLRKKYTNSDKETDITIIEIRQNKDEIKNYLELDEKDIYENEKNKELEYRKKSIYILHYPEGELKVSYGLINNITKNKTINHYCNTKGGSSGSPILSLKTLKVIGIHYASSNNFNFNYGMLIKNAIDLFNKHHNKNKIKKQNKKNSNEGNNNLDNVQFDQKNYFIDKNKPIKNPLDIYKEPTLIGLNNIGAACFINSILQCLSQTKLLTNFFLKDSKYKIIMENNIAKQNKNLLQLSPIYRELIKMLWNKNKKGISFSPNEFMETVEKMNPLFKKGQTGDYKGFIIFILEQIHKELKRPINSQNQSHLEPLNHYDRKKTFNYFMNAFIKECSIISDIFFGFIEITSICLHCNDLCISKGLNCPIWYNYEIFNCLIFPLEEVKNFRNNYCINNNIQINQNNSVTLNECFFFNQKTEKFTGDNRNYCKICNQLFDSEETSRIYSSPNVLILILDRGKDNKNNIKLNFTETLDLTQFVVFKDHPQMIYNLYGVITSYGQSGPNAHFISFCKSSINNKWYKYNDAIVNPVEDVQKEIINFGIPYILFYQKSN